MRNLEKSGPWCWMEKAALRKIRETFDGTHNVSSALGVYHALAEVASDKGEEKFQTTYAWLAGLSGFSQRTVGERARELEDIGLLKVTVPTLRGPATYSLVQISNGCRTIGNGCVTIGNGEAPPLPTSEEKKKEEIEAMVAHQENGDSGSAFSDARKGLL